MQPEKIQVTDEDIKYTEKILLEEREYFDDERIAFIKNFEPIDLQAVPGSGKTTALLAKLLILERHLPFKDGSGILVISRTNTAVNEIKNKIGKYCPKLFAYPNFVGTIQSFVDQFLAIPFAHSFLNTRLRWIDTELYQELLWKKFQSICWVREFGKPGTFFYGRHFQNCLKESKNDQNKAKELCNQRIEKEVKDLFLDFLDQKIKTFSGKKVILSDSSNKKYQGIKKIIEEILNKEVVSYEYAYNLANAFIQKAPIIKRLIQKRFKCVFVDEMQDMEKHQHDLLEDLFYCDEVVYQRIGDKNQAIYSGKVSLEDIWEDRETVLPLKGSHRLSPKIAQIVHNFALDATFQIEGKRDHEISPCVIVFSDDCIEQVLPKFIELVIEKVPDNDLSKSKHPIKVIGWRKDKDENGNLGIKSYCEDFEPEVSNTKISHPCLKSHLTLWKAFSNQKHLLNITRKSILEALIAILTKEEIIQTNGRYFNIISLYKYLRDFHRDFYEEFKLKVFIWSRDVYKGKIDSVLQDIKNFIPNLLKIFGKQIDRSAGFINGDDILELQKQSGTSSTMRDNVYDCPITGLKVEIDTVHSAKGETHLATLYVETFYSKKHESDRLSKCFCGQGNIFSNKTEKETAKIAYVAMSRPTHLLCFALRQVRFNAIKDKIDGWEIIELAVKDG